MKKLIVVLILGALIVLGCGTSRKGGPGVSEEPTPQLSEAEMDSLLLRLETEDPYGEGLYRDARAGGDRLPRCLLIVQDGKGVRRHFPCDSVAVVWDKEAKTDLYLLYDTDGSLLGQVAMGRGYKVWINQYDERKWKRYGKDPSKHPEAIK